MFVGRLRFPGLDGWKVLVLPVDADFSTVLLPLAPLRSILFVGISFSPLSGYNEP